MIFLKNMQRFSVKRQHILEKICRRFIIMNPCLFYVRYDVRSGGENFYSDINFSGCFVGKKYWQIVVGVIW